MFELDPVRPKRHARLVASAAVFSIAYKRHFPRGKLDSYLVRSARDEFDFNERYSLAVLLPDSLLNSVIQYRFLDSCPLSGTNIRLVFHLVVKYKVAHLTHRCLGCPVNYRKISLLVIFRLNESR